MQLVKGDCLSRRHRSPLSPRQHCHRVTAGTKPLPHSQGTFFHPHWPQGCARGWGQALPFLQELGWAVILWQPQEPTERVRRTPAHRPLAGVCQPSSVAGIRGCPAPQHCREPPELHLRAPAGPRVQNSSSWSVTALFCQPSRHAAMHICFPKLRRNWENSGRRSQRLEISFHLLGYDLC